MPPDFYYLSPYARARSHAIRAYAPLGAKGLLAPCPPCDQSDVGEDGERDSLQDLPRRHDTGTHAGSSVPTSSL